MSAESDLRKFLDAKKNKYGTNYAENTIKTYINAMMLFTKGDFNKLKNKELFLKYLETKSTSSKVNTTRAIMSNLDFVNADDELKKWYKDLLTKLIKDYKSGNNIIANKNKKAITHINEWASVQKDYRSIVRKVRKATLKRKTDWTADDKRLYQIYVIASLYYLIPPRRNVYASMQVLKGEQSVKPKTNYLIVGDRPRDPMYFIFGDYKTFGKYGTKKTQVGKTLELVLRPWIRRINPLRLTSKPFLYNLRDNTQMTNHNLTNFITRNVFKGVGTQRLRRLFDSQKHIVDAKSILVDNADKMNHSVNVAISTYIPDK